MKENIQDNTQDKNDEIKIEAHVGDTVLIILQSGGAVLGMITEVREGFVTDAETAKFYRVGIGGDQYVDIIENEIKDIKIYNLINKDDYFERMKSEYGIEFCNQDGELKEIPDIVNDFLVKGAWDRLADEEKNTLIDTIGMSVENEVYLINALNMSRKRNNELHQQVMKLLEDRTKAVQAVIDFQNDWNDKTDKMPEIYRYAFELMYKTMGIDKLLKAI